MLGKENRAPTAWLLGLGTPLPFFLALLVAPLLPLEAFMGPAQSQSAVVLVFAVAAAVTSIPVITKIFYDLGILHTRFASLMLGAAVLEDIALWGVLSVATAPGAASLAALDGGLAETIAVHVGANLGYVAVAMLLAPALLRGLGRASWNRLALDTPVAWIMLALFGYVAAAAALDVTLVFAGFRGLDLINLALTCNARGGPGIVLASVAFDAGIINAPFFTTLVPTAVVTSQACGFWLDFVLRRGWPLLSGADLQSRGLSPGSDEAPAERSRAPATVAARMDRRSRSS